MARRLTLIEFVKDTAARSAGTRLRVDDLSAVSLVDRKKVAVRVDEGAPAAPEPRKPRRGQADEPTPVEPEPDGE